MAALYVGQQLRKIRMKDRRRKKRNGSIEGAEKDGGEQNGAQLSDNSGLRNSGSVRHRGRFRWYYDKKWFHGEE